MSEEAEKPKLRIPCEVYSRIVGYLRPLDAWNVGKQQEFKDRVVYGAHLPPKKEGDDEAV